MRLTGEIVVAFGCLTVFPLLAALSNNDGVAVRSDLIWACAMIAAGCGIMIWRGVAAARFDPNAEDAEKRKSLGKTLAVSRDEYKSLEANEEVKRQNRKEQARRNMAGGFGLPDPLNELKDCPYCGVKQEAKNKKCMSCSRALA